jgi:type V secretory pathway adhesin AidA
MKIRISLFAVLFLLGCGLFAQEDTATITGVVTDPSGALVPNATVKATNDANSAALTVTTNAQGVYAIPYLQPGV